VSPTVEPWQRRALREVGENPNAPQVRSPEIVEKYLR